MLHSEPPTYPNADACCTDSMLDDTFEPLALHEATLHVEQYLDTFQGRFFSKVQGRGRRQARQEEAKESEGGRWTRTLGRHYGEDEDDEEEEDVRVVSQVNLNVVGSISEINSACNCPKVLVVDDDPFNIIALEGMLGMLGVRAIEKAFNGKDGLIKIQQN